jgi:hypothetical protein
MRQNKQRGGGAPSLHSANLPAFFGDEGFWSLSKCEKCPEAAKF